MQGLLRHGPAGISIDILHSDHFQEGKEGSSDSVDGHISWPTAERTRLGRYA